MTSTTEHRPTSIIDADMQIEQNLAVYLKRKEETEKTYPTGKILLMNNGEIKGAYNDDEDAYSIACERYGLGNFSLHHVGQKPIELGIFGV